MIRTHRLLRMSICCWILVQIEAPYLKDSEITPGVTDTYLTVPKMIAKYGYPTETHIVQTQDGYLLECHRIPNGKLRNSSINKPYSILLVHGILLSSECWISNGPNASLAYALADEGYDVWMLNLRGNTYSRSHVSLTPIEEKFWDFCGDESAEYDLSATIDYILNTTNSKKLVYIGYSLGTSLFYILAATRPDYSNKILFQISLAPAGPIPHTTSAIRLLLPMVRRYQSNPRALPVLEHDEFISALIKLLCNSDTQTGGVVCNRIFIAPMVGYDPKQFSQRAWKISATYALAGTSLKTLFHVVQGTDSVELKHYDYGFTGNMKKYGTAKPPIYNTSLISVPMKFYQGRNDKLADAVDSQLLYRRIQKPMGYTFIEYDKWNHGDFVYAIDLKRYLTEPVLEFIREVTGNTESIGAIVKSAIRERDRASIRVNKPIRPG